MQRSQEKKATLMDLLDAGALTVEEDWLTAARKTASDATEPTDSIAPSVPTQMAPTKNAAAKSKATVKASATDAKAGCKEKPPPPKSARDCFCAATRADFAQRYPGAARALVIKLQAEAWAGMSAAERQKYVAGERPITASCD